MLFYCITFCLGKKKIRRAIHDIVSLQFNHKLITAAWQGSIMILSMDGGDCTKWHTESSAPCYCCMLGNRRAWLFHQLEILEPLLYLFIYRLQHIHFVVTFQKMEVMMNVAASLTWSSNIERNCTVTRSSHYQVCYYRHSPVISLLAGKYITLYIWCNNNTDKYISWTARKVDANVNSNLGLALHVIFDNDLGAKWIS